MNNYKMTIKGSIENLGGFLSDLVEHRVTPLNNNHPNLEFKDMSWNSTFDLSVATAEFSSDKVVSKNELAIIREQYGVSVSNRRVAV
jgi:hypothetical protein